MICNYCSMDSVLWHPLPLTSASFHRHIMHVGHRHTSKDGFRCKPQRFYEFGLLHRSSIPWRKIHKLIPQIDMIRSHCRMP